MTPTRARALAREANKSKLRALVHQPLARLRWTRRRAARSAATFDAPAAATSRTDARVARAVHDASRCQSAQGACRRPSAAACAPAAAACGAAPPVRRARARVVRRFASRRFAFLTPRGGAGGCLPGRCCLCFWWRWPRSGRCGRALALHWAARGSYRGKSWRCMTAPGRAKPSGWPCAARRVRRSA